MTGVQWSSGVPRLGHRRKRVLTGQQKRGRPEGHRLGGGHWLVRGQDGRTEEGAVTQRRSNTTGVDRTTVARRQTSSIYYVCTVRCEVCSRSLLSVAGVCTMHNIDKATIL